MITLIQTARILRLLLSSFSALCLVPSSSLWSTDYCSLMTDYLFIMPSAYCFLPSSSACSTDYCSLITDYFFIICLTISLLYCSDDRCGTILQQSLVDSNIDSILVKNSIFTAETPRTQSGYFLFGGERPPNKKLTLVSEHAFFTVPQL
jgi:hypothetical protein